MATNATAVLAQTRRNRFTDYLKRSWIEASIPYQPENLSRDGWKNIHKRYRDAGGDSEELNHIIERDSADD